MTVQLVATCLFGLEKLLGEEIARIGGRRTETMDGRISFEGDLSMVAAANLRLRYAERVFIRLGSFSATTFDELFEGTRALPWEEGIGRDESVGLRRRGSSTRLSFSCLRTWRPW